MAKKDEPKYRFLFAINTCGQLIYHNEDFEYTQFIAQINPQSKSTDIKNGLKAEKCFHWMQHKLIDTSYEQSSDPAKSYDMR